MEVGQRRQLPPRYTPQYERSLVIHNGGVFIVGSLLWGVIFDDFHPDRYDIAGAIACLIGIAVIMYAPR